MSDRINIRNACKQMYLALRYSIINICVFELFFKIATLLIFRPLIRWSVSMFINAGGYSVVLNAQIGAFLTGFTGVLMSLFLTVLAMVLVYYEFAVLLFFLHSGYRHKNVCLYHGLKMGAKALESLWHPSSIGFAIFALVLIPLLDISFEASLMPGINIPRFITGEIARYPGGWILIDLIQWVPLFVFIKLVFVLPGMVLERLNFITSLKQSMLRIKGNTLRSSAVIFIAFSCLYIPLYLLDIMPINASTLIRPMISAIIDLLQMFGTPVLLAAIYASHAQVTDPAVIDSRLHDASTSEIRMPLKAFINLVEYIARLTSRGIALLWHRCIPHTVKQRPVVYMAILFMIPVYVNSRNHYTFGSPCLIIGHRGSADAVENTIPAALSAIKQKADYIEIDTMLSKDGVPVVMHDYNLFRLAGRIDNVHDLTARQLSSLTLRQFDHEAQMTTLDTFCKAVKGKAKLLVELKSHENDTQSVVDRVVQVIRDNEMEQECIFQTTEPELLQEIQRKYPHNVSGFVIVSGVGDISLEVLSHIPADFFNVEDSMINEDIVENCHILKKPIYVWTVNDPKLIRSLIGMHVDGIVTDYPQQTRGVITDPDYGSER